METSSVYNTAEKKPKMRLKSILMTVGTLVVFGILFSRIPITSVLEALGRCNLWYLFAALLLTLLFPMLCAVRWQVILKTMGYAVNFTECFKIVLGAWPISSITPSKSGDLAKAFYLKDRVPMSKTAGSVLTEKIFDVFSLLVFALFGSLVTGQHRITLIASVLLAGMGMVLGILSLNLKLPVQKKWQDRFDNLFVSLKLILRNGRILGLVLFFGFLNWFLTVVQTHICFLALDKHVPMFFVFANIPMAIFIGLLPVTIGGMGTRDSAIIFLFGSFASPSELLTIGILYSFFGYWALSIIGLPYMRSLLNRKSTNLQTMPHADVALSAETNNPG